MLNEGYTMFYVGAITILVATVSLMAFTLSGLKRCMGMQNPSWEEAKKIGLTKDLMRSAGSAFIMLLGGLIFAIGVIAIQIATGNPVIW